MKNFKKNEAGSFPCECGKAYSSAKRFSDHAHECEVNPIQWQPTADYRAAEKALQ